MATVTKTFDKRAELVRAASDLLYEQGFFRTTLADVASRSRVPLGNVYYYFKTKPALAQAVIEFHIASLRALFEGWEQASDEPKERLRRLAFSPKIDAATILRLGCPNGSLCQELDKLGPDDPLARSGVRLMETYLVWAEQQFRLAGLDSPQAAEAAEHLVAGIQGAMLLAQATHSEALLDRRLASLSFWLDGLL